MSGVYGSLTADCFLTTTKHRRSERAVRYHGRLRYLKYLTYLTEVSRYLHCRHDGLKSMIIRHQPRGA